MYWKVLRSKVSSVLVFTLLFSLLLPALSWGATTVALKDISDSYAQKEIQSLVDNGIISGYEDGSFQPRKTITRAELAKIIVLSLGLKENPEKASVFTDVYNTKNWYTGFVGALVESKITEGTSATTFAPDAKVTREELAVFFIRALGLEETATKVAVDAKVSDLNTVSSWAQAHVSLAFKAGFLQGIDDGAGAIKFSPKENSERQAVARLAYEFKNNKDTIVNKAKSLAIGALAVSSAAVTNNTTVEVTFNQAVGSVAASDFTFDNNLTVTKAELKSGSTTVVVLTTSLQTGGTVYKLSYLGKDTGVKITGAATAGSGSSSSSNDRRYTAPTAALTPAEILSSNDDYTTAPEGLRLSEGGTFGPTTGLKKITGTLILDPGPTGQITLNNIQADNIVVASGSRNSIILFNVEIKVSLKIDTTSGNGGQVVRVEVKGTTVIASTYVRSGAIIESTGGRFGNINIEAGAAGQEIELRGTITDAVYVNASVTVNVYAKATVDVLNLGANATVKTQEGSKLTNLVVAKEGIQVSLDGAGTISNVSTTKEVTKGFKMQPAKTSKIKILTFVFLIAITVDVIGDNADLKISLEIAINTANETAKSGGKETTPKDPTSPTTVTTLTYKGVTSTEATLNWNASKGDSKVVKYAIFQVNVSDSKPIKDNVTDLTYTLTGLNSATKHDYYVKAYYDASNNYSDPSNTVSFTTKSVTSVTYVTYNTSNTVASSVYGGSSESHNQPAKPFNISAGNVSDYLIVGFSEALLTDSVTITSTPTASVEPTKTVTSNTYLAIKHKDKREAKKLYEIKIDGLKNSKGNAVDTVTFYVYQE